MADEGWALEGRYFETCNCDFLCPCITSNLTAEPTQGDCKVALAFQIERGSKAGVGLDGLCFIIVARTPGAMGKGNWTVGLVVDERATQAQADAILAIASGQAGGPMAHIAPAIGTFAGVERRAIAFTASGNRYSVRAGDLVDQACEGAMASPNAKEPIALENTGHPVSARLALAHATRQRFHAFGIDWDESTGRCNGHFAPFRWHA